MICCPVKPGTPSSGGVSTFIALSDTPADYTGADGKICVVNGTADGLIFLDTLGPTQGGTGLNSFTAGDLIFSDGPDSLAALPIAADGKVLEIAGGLPSWQTPAAGVTTFIALSDTPANYSGAALDLVRVNAAGNGLEFFNTVDELHGGTNQTSYTTGDLLYASGANTLAKLPAASDGEFLTLTAGVPAWAPAITGAANLGAGAEVYDAVLGSDITLRSLLAGTQMTATQGPNEILFDCNSPSAFIALSDTPANYVGAALQLVRVNAGGTGLEFFTPLDESHGGTGLTSYSTGDLIYADGANSLNKRAIGSDGEVLTVVAGVPDWAPAGGGGGGGTILGGTPGFEWLISAGTDTPAGNPRGLYAVDLQNERGGASQVASGNGAVICGGANNAAAGGTAGIGGGNGNSASGLGARVGGGNNNQATNQCSYVGGGTFNTAGGYCSSIGGGGSNLASASYSHIGGGFDNQVSGAYAYIGGGTRGRAALNGERATGHDQVGQQHGELPLRMNVTTGTAVAIMSLVGTSTNRVTLLANEFYSCTLYLDAIGVGASNGDRASWELNFYAFRTGSGNITLVDDGTFAPTKSVSGTTGTWALQIAPYTYAQAIELTVTGEAGKTIYWSGYIRYNKLTTTG